ncbi:MAG: uroporphyrinogen-III synthase [Luteibaculaceae bacterium]
MEETVFLSAEAERFPLLISTIKNSGNQIIASPLIEFKPVPFTLEKSYSWVFFPSPRAVHFFFLSAEPNATKLMQWACLGSGTAKSLQEVHQSPNFTGNKADTKENVLDFITHLKPNDTVLVPHGDKSLRSVTQTLNQQWAGAVDEVCIYQTNLIANRFSREFKTLIFTSPSNVDAYFAHNKTSPKTQCLAIGNTTASALEKYVDAAQIKVAHYPSDAALSELYLSVNL